MVASFTTSLRNDAARSGSNCITRSYLGLHPVAKSPDGSSKNVPDTIGCRTYTPWWRIGGCEPPSPKTAVASIVADNANFQAQQPTNIRLNPVHSLTIPTNSLSHPHQAMALPAKEVRWRNDPATACVHIHPFINNSRYSHSLGEIHPPTQEANPVHHESSLHVHLKNSVCSYRRWNGDRGTTTIADSY